MSSRQLTTIDFHGDTIFAIKDGERVLVAVTPICETLGLAPQRQRERIQRDPILSQGGTMMVLPSVGGPQKTLCLPLNLLHGWLFTIDDRRVRPAIRERVLVYKRECYEVLFRHFEAKAAQRYSHHENTFGSDRIVGNSCYALICEQGPLEAYLHRHQLQTLAALRGLPQGEGGLIQTSYARLADMAGLSEHSVRRHVQFLTKVGLSRLTPDGVYVLPPPGFLEYRSTLPNTRH